MCYIVPIETNGAGAEYSVYEDKELGSINDVNRVLKLYTVETESEDAAKGL